MNRRPFYDHPPCEVDRVLLHTCCAPCSSAIIEWLVSNGVQPVIYYSNPNIYPADEYDRRRDECRRYAASMNVEMIEDRYDHQAWLDYVAGLEHEPERGARCHRCFAMRLERTARYADTHGFSLIATTLASSRWKNLEQIADAGLEATAPYEGRVLFWDQNWRRNGLSERRAALLRQYNFYNQQYCGCEYSMSPSEQI